MPLNKEVLSLLNPPGDFEQYTVKTKVPHFKDAIPFMNTKILMGA